MRDTPDDETLVRSLLNELDSERTAEVAAWVARDETARTRLERYRVLLAALSARQPVDLLPAINQGLAARRRVRRRNVMMVAGVALAASLGVVALVGSLGQEDVRSKGTPVRDGDWAGLVASRVSPEGVASPLGPVLLPTDALTFSYSNGGPRPFTHLLVFGVEASGEVRWYYPAWEDPMLDPEASPIVPSNTALDLPEKISHALKPGPFVLHAIFARSPLHVSQVERALAGRPPSKRLDLEATTEQVFVTEVK